MVGSVPMVNGETTTFRGWHRANRQAGWRPVCGATTEVLAWDKLLALRLAGDKAVLPAGAVPWAKPVGQKGAA